MKKHSYNQPLPENKYNPLAWVHPNAKIGDNCWIGAFCRVSERVEIGDHVSLACGVLIYDHDTSHYRSREGNLPYKHYKITIGSYTQIGSNTVIVPKNKDITIGDHVIIGALSLCKTDIPSYSIVGGIPAKVIGDVPRNVAR